MKVWQILLLALMGLLLASCHSNEANYKAAYDKAKAKQRESIGDDAPNALLSAVIEANVQRKDYLAETVLALNPKRIGFYRLVAKHGSDNLRSSATLDLMNNLVDCGAEVMVYEPLVNPDTLRGVQRVASLEELANSCDIILANRLSEELLPYQDKVFTRDLYNCD